MREEKLIEKVALLYRWIRLSQNGISIWDLITQRGYGSIAVYGYTEIARCLFYEEKSSKVSVKCLVDKRGDRLSFDYSVVSSESFTGEDIDALLVTLVDEDELVDHLKKTVKCDVITIEELLYEL